MIFYLLFVEGNLTFVSLYMGDCELHMDDINTRDLEKQADEIYGCSLEQLGDSQIRELKSVSGYDYEIVSIDVSRDELENYLLNKKDNEIEVDNEYNTVVTISDIIQNLEEDTLLYLLDELVLKIEDTILNI